jgi:hypothetical protein
VCFLAKRLNATVDIGHHGGASFALRFPLKADEPVEPRAD